MERIIIIGGNGCGKTTFAKALSEKLALPLIHIDALYWRDNWQAASDYEFDELLMQEIQTPRWVIDGNNKRTIPLRLAYCDTAIFMDFSMPACFYGSIKRVIINYGKSRSDMGGNCPEYFDLKFFKFLKTVITFNRKNRKYYYEMLNKSDGVKIIVIKNRRQLSAFMQSLK